MLSASCSEQQGEPDSERLKPGLTVIVDDLYVPRPFGSQQRETPSGLSKDEADRAYEANLDEACKTIETRIVEGRILSDGRTCALLSADGLVPTKTLVFEGHLRTTKGEMLEVAWIVQESPGSLTTDLSAACRMDPTQGKSGPWILSRNRPDNLWHLAPHDEWTDSRWSFAPDAIRESCAEREASARRVQALVARQRERR